MKQNENSPKRYFQDNDELTVDGSSYRKQSFLLRSYVLVPLIFMTFLIVGSILLLGQMNP